MVDKDIAVTGLGLVTPAGIGVDATWGTVCAGRSTAAPDPRLAGNAVAFSCQVQGFDAEALLGPRRAYRLDPFVQFALVAAKEALADANLDPQTWDGARVGVVLGSCIGGSATLEREHRAFLQGGAAKVSPYLLPMELSNMLAGEMAIEFGATGPNLVVTTACASGATAIGMARDLLMLDRCDVVLTGASEAGVTPLRMVGFERLGALSRRVDDPASASRPFDVDRDGFVGGEGAGILVLERVKDARARNARVRARVVGYGATADAHHVTKPHPLGRGSEAAVRAALADASAGPGDVAHVNAHGTSTPLNDKSEASMLNRALTGSPVVTSTKGTTGHLLGAAGAAEAVLTILAVERSLVPPTANLVRQDPAIDIDVPVVARQLPIDLALSNSFGFGGQNVVLAFASA